MFEYADDLLSVEETAELLKVGRGAIYPLLISGELKGFRNGRVWRIPKEAVVHYVRQKSKLR